MILYLVALLHFKHFHPSKLTCWPPPPLPSSERKSSSPLKSQPVSHQCTPREHKHSLKKEKIQTPSSHQCTPRECIHSTLNHNQSLGQSSVSLRHSACKEHLKKVSQKKKKLGKYFASKIIVELEQNNFFHLVTSNIAGLTLFVRALPNSPQIFCNWTLIYNKVIIVYKLCN